VTIRQPPAFQIDSALLRVVGVDWQTQQVLLDDDGAAATFDYLVLVAGVVSAFAGVPGAPPMRSR
jgi:NADH dehydrogenase FAD-containing subunit